MEAELTKKIVSLGLIYQDISETSIKKIHGLFCLGQTDLEPENGEEYFYFGSYSYCVEKNYELSKMYYLRAIEQGNLSAYVNLAIYSRDIEKNNLLFHHYIKRVLEECTKKTGKEVERLRVRVLHDLGFHYQIHEKNYESMKSCYCQTIEMDNVLSMFNLGYYYQRVEKNYELMLKYYLMAIERGNVIAMYYLARHYETDGSDYTLMVKYHQMAIKLGYLPSVDELEKYYLQTDQAGNWIEPFTLGIEQQRIKLIDRFYHPSQVHQLTRVNNHDLNPVLIREKHAYLYTLFHNLRQDLTWFHSSYCVKDVMEMIQEYVKA